MMIARILAILMAAAQLMIPPYANEFLRKARWAHLGGFLLFFAGFSCSVNISSDSIKSNEEDDSEEVAVDPYTSIPSVAEETETEPTSNDPWQCGYEILVVKGPHDELMYAEIPLPCDPMADVYKGCFVEEKTLKK